METLEQYNDRISKRYIEDISSLLKTEYGMRFIWSILMKANAFHQTFVQGEPDSTAFNEGRRSIGNNILADVLAVRPDAYVDMYKMNQEDENARRNIESANQDFEVY